MRVRRVSIGTSFASLVLGCLAWANRRSPKTAWLLGAAVRGCQIRFVVNHGIKIWGGFQPVLAASVGAFWVAPAGGGDVFGSVGLPCRPWFDENGGVASALDPFDFCESGPTPAGVRNRACPGVAGASFSENSTLP